jgi:hypothetical protein
MRKLLSSGLVMFAGVVSPVAISHRQADAPPPPDARKAHRFEALRKFFQKSDCPAQHYSEVFLEAADRYALDWRLLPSLSYVESTGGKQARNNNLFGWDSGKAVFASPAEGIREVGSRLANSDLYRHKDLDTMLATYNPNADYGQRVKWVMRQIAPEE